MTGRGREQRLFGTGLEFGVHWCTWEWGWGGRLSQAGEVWTLAGALWETCEGLAIADCRPAAGCLRAFSLSLEEGAIMIILVS